MSSDITPGSIFPSYALPDHTGTVRTLSELQRGDPLVLTLARGHYCPKEHQQHLELAAFQSAIAVAYTQIVTISTDDRQGALQEFRASVSTRWTFSDPSRVIQKDLDIRECPDPGHDPMIPHTLVLKPGLMIHTVYNGYWFWGRPFPCTTCGATCARRRPRSGRTGTQHAGAARPGPPGTGRRSTGCWSRRSRDNVAAI